MLKLKDRPLTSGQIDILDRMAEEPYRWFSHRDLGVLVAPPNIDWVSSWAYEKCKSLAFRGFLCGRKNWNSFEWNISSAGLAFLGGLDGQGRR